MDAARGLCTSFLPPPPPSPPVPQPPTNLTLPSILKKKKYAQELLQTFSLSLGEVALQPSTGGVFVVELFSSINPRDQETGSSSSRSGSVGVQKTVIWDRKVDGGFPETKELKRRVRDVIQPGRDLGHVDRHSKQGEGKNEEGKEEGEKKEKGEAVAGGQACGVEGKCEHCQ